jgi:hypothetical protein
MAFTYEDYKDPNLLRSFRVTNGDGLPGALCQDCFVALLVLREQQGAPDVHFYVREITRLIFGSPRGRSKRLRVKLSLQRLATTVLVFTDSFYEGSGREYISTKIEALFPTARIYEHRHGKNHMDARQENVFRLSDLVEKNLAGRYFNYVDFEDYKQIRSGVPRRLFLYLTKKADGWRKKDFTIHVEKLYSRIPITAQKAAARFECLAKAAKDIEKVGIAHRFNDDKITFRFEERRRRLDNRRQTSAAKKTPSLVEAPATPQPPESTTPQLSMRDLVEYFYRGIKVDRVSARRMSEGLEVLRRVQAESGADIPTMKRMIDWVLERREKFKGLHSIKILEAVWDQALADIQRQQKAEAQAAEQARKTRGAEQAIAQAASQRRDGLAAMRVGLSDAERAALRLEAEQRFEADPRLGFAREMFRESEKVGGMTRDEHIGMIEDGILEEQASTHAGA